MLNLPNPVRLSRIVPAIAAIFLLTIILSSCADDKQTPLAADSPEKKEFKMNCVMLNRAQLQAWVDSGWTRPGSTGKINTLLLQFYSHSSKTVGNDAQLMVPCIFNGYF